jgi:hypothetical protein
VHSGPVLRHTYGTSETSCRTSSRPQVDAAHATACGPVASAAAAAVATDGSGDAAGGGGWLPSFALRPPECEEMLSAPSQLLPFDLKHGLQQASIVGAWAGLPYIRRFRTWRVVLGGRGMVRQSAARVGSVVLRTRGW